MEIISGLFLITGIYNTQSFPRTFYLCYSLCYCSHSTEEKRTAHCTIGYCHGMDFPCVADLSRMVNIGRT